MMSPARLHRRHVVRSIPVVLGACAISLPASGAPNAQWTPANGVRIAGPTWMNSELDPARSRDVQTNGVLSQIFRGLTTIGPDMLPTGMLADVTEVASDGRSYVFRINDGACFHDGREITADVVIASLSRAVSPSTANGDASGLLGVSLLSDIARADRVIAGDAEVLSGIEPHDTRSFTIRLDQPSGTFLSRLATVPASIVDPTTSDWRLPNGSGPYRVASNDGESMITLASSQDWIGATPVVKSVSVLIGSGASNPTTIFERGDLDLVQDVPAQLVELLTDPASGSGDPVFADSPQFALVYLQIGGNEPPLDDLAVRKALQTIVPTEPWVESVFGERAIVPNGLIPPGVLGREWPAELPGFDPDAAREWIRRSRYRRAEDVPPISLYASDVQLLQALSSVAARELGLQIDVVKVPWEDFLTGLTERRWDAYSMFWQLDFPDPAALLRVLCHSESADNYVGYANPDVDALLDQAAVTMDPQARNDVFSRAQQILIDDAAMIPLYVPKLFAMGRSGMTHLPLTPMGMTALERLT